MQKESIENYLRIIYSIINKKKCEEVKPSEVSKKLKITRATTTKMLKKLKENGYIINKPYSKIRLTKKGVIEGKKINEKYNTIINFLRYIGYSKNNEIKKEAHRLEHAFSNRTMKKIKNMIKRVEK